MNGGAIDPLAEICAAAREADAWVHVDGAFGLWAAPARRAAPSSRAEPADSWTTDAHKWLNVPVRLRHRDRPRHRGAPRRDGRVRRATSCRTPTAPRDPLDWTPEFSRRARGVAVYATLRTLGRSGVAELVDRCCAMRRALRVAPAATDGAEVLHAGAQPGARPACGDDADHSGDARRRAGGGHVLAERHDVARADGIRLSVCSFQTGRRTSTARRGARRPSSHARAAGARRAGRSRATPRVRHRAFSAGGPTTRRRARRATRRDRRADRRRPPGATVVAAQLGVHGQRVRGGRAASRRRAARPPGTRAAGRSPAPAACGSRGGAALAATPAPDRASCARDLVAARVGTR